MKNDFVLSLGSRGLAATITWWRIAIFLFLLLPLTASADIINGLVGYWTFDERDTTWTSSTTGTTRDLSGQGNAGILTNMNHLADTRVGKIGQALNFDGIDNVVNLGAPSVLDLTSTFTISAWIYPRTLGGSGRGRIFDKTQYAFYPDSSICGDGALNLLISGVGGCSSGDIVKLNQWQQVVATYRESGTPQVAFYVDGIAQGGSTPGTALHTSGITAYIGNRAGGDRAFDGLIDDVRVYDRALSPADVAELQTFTGLVRPPVPPLPATTAAILSKLAYQSAGDITSSSLPAGYSLGVTCNICAPLEMGSNTSQFHAIAFKGPDGIVVAFQGTTPPMFEKSTYADLGLAPGLPETDQLNAYRSMANTFLSQVQRLAPNLQVHLTGHSLGGAIAQILGNQTGLDTVTFNAPGTAIYMQSQQIMNLSNTANIRNYRMAGDLVSLLPVPGQQVGEVITLSNNSPNSTNDPLDRTGWLNNHMCIVTARAGCNPDSQPLSDLKPNAEGTTNTSPLYPTGVAVGVGLLDSIGVAFNIFTNIKDGVKNTVRDFSNSAIKVTKSILTWLDPPSASEYDFATRPGDPNFSSVILPTQADPYDLMALVNGVWMDMGLLRPLTTFDFADGGVSAFKVLGIDKGLTDFDPFIVGVTFADDGQFGGTITSISAVTVSVPGTFALLVLGLLGIARARQFASSQRTT